MQFVLIIHEVENYSDWKIGFDKASNIRKSAGELEYQVLTYVNEPNRVVHFSQWQSHAKAKAFFESETVANIRKKLGVKTPEFIYLNQVEAGRL